jgi:hypothetical protein
MTAIYVGDIVEENGQTITQNNLQKQHNIPLGSLVEIFSTDDEKWNDPEGIQHGLRLWVTGHTRDCDGTPLYALSFNKNAYAEFKNCERQAESGDKLVNHMKQYYRGQFDDGYSEESLIVIKAHQAK